jgi:hypothetical protein
VLLSSSAFAVEEKGRSPVFEVESWLVAEGKKEEHARAMRGWLKFVKEHPELFKEWKSVRYFVKTFAGDETDRHFVIWEYESLAAFEAYKERRGDYKGAYAEYKKHDPYYMGVFEHNSMRMEVWKSLEKDLWIE